MDGYRSQKAIACDVFTSENDAKDEDRKQGKSSSKMDEVDSNSEQYGCKSKVCNDGRRDKICWRSFRLAEGGSVYPTIWIKRLVIPCSILRQSFGCIQKCNTYHNVEETRIFDPRLIWIILKAI